jgi:hypothetical protein
MSITKEQFDEGTTVVAALADLALPAFGGVISDVEQVFDQGFDLWQASPNKDPLTTAENAIKVLLGFATKAVGPEKLRALLSDEALRLATLAADTAENAKFGEKSGAQ